MVGRPRSEYGGSGLLSELGQRVNQSGISSGAVSIDMLSLTHAQVRFDVCAYGLAIIAGLLHKLVPLSIQLGGGIRIEALLHFPVVIQRQKLQGSLKTESRRI